MSRQAFLREGTLGICLFGSRVEHMEIGMPETAGQGAALYFPARRRLDDRRPSTVRASDYGQTASVRCVAMPHQKPLVSAHELALGHEHQSGVKVKDLPMPLVPVFRMAVKYRALIIAFQPGLPIPSPFALGCFQRFVMRDNHINKLRPLCLRKSGRKSNEESSCLCGTPNLVLSKPGLRLSWK